LTLQFVKLCGARAIAVDLSSARAKLELAGKYGADLIVENDKADAMAEVRKYTGGVGADYVFECTALESCINQGLLMLRRLGTFVELGITSPEGTTLKYFLLSILQGHTIVCAFGHRLHTWPRVIRLMAEGKITVKELITHRFTFDEYKEAFSCKDPDRLKILLTP
jgi:L-iditol 2-dehydrogenase